MKKSTSIALSSAVLASALFTAPVFAASGPTADVLSAVTSAKTQTVLLSVSSFSENGAPYFLTSPITIDFSGTCIATTSETLTPGPAGYSFTLPFTSGNAGKQCTIKNTHGSTTLGTTTFTVPNPPTPKPTPKPRPVLPFVDQVSVTKPALTLVFPGQKLTFTGTATMNNGLPASNTTVTIGYNSRQNVTTTTNSQGQFSFSITPKTPGKSTLVVSDGLGSQTIPFQVTAIVPTKIVLNIQKTAVANGDVTVNGVVLNNNGTPSFGQTVQINVGQNQQYAITSNFQGQFSLTEPVFSVGQESVIAETDGITAKTKVTVVKPTPKPNPTPKPQPVVNPQPKPKPTPSVVPSKKFDPIAIKWYVVKPGDNLWNISQKFYGTVWDYISIAQINHIANPRLIYPGERLKLENMEW